MIRVRDEGGEIRQGFNFYPFSNRGSRGFVLRIGALLLKCRYSRAQSRWCFSKDRIAA